VLKLYDGIKTTNRDRRVDMAKKGNPSPVQTEKFKAKQFKPIGEIPGDYPLAKKVTGVKLPIDVHEAIWALPEKERISWLRRVICDAARSELIALE
jgi:hypothetical protein